MIDKDEAWPDYTNDFFDIEIYTTETELEW